MNTEHTDTLPIGVRAAMNYLQKKNDDRERKEIRSGVIIFVIAIIYFFVMFNFLG